MNETKKFNDENRKLQNHLHDVYHYDKIGIICGLILLGLFIGFWIF